MSRFRFSTVALLGGVLLIGLCFGTLRSLPRTASNWAVGMGGLCLGTIFFAAVVGLSGHSASRTTWVSAGLYAWGVGCLVLVENFHIEGGARIAMGAAGALYMTWAWFPREPGECGVRNAEGGVRSVGDSNTE